MRKPRIQDAVVVGGGPVGLALALALHQAGFAATLVVERPPPPFDPAAEVDARVYALAPDILAGLDAMGVAARLRSTRACPYTRMEVRDAGSTARIAFDAAEYGWAELGLIVEHALLVDALWQALGAAGIDIQTCNRRLEWHAEDEAWRLPDLGLRTRLLLAADGANSALRAAAGIAVEQRPYGQDALVAHVRFELPHRDTAWQRFLPEGPLALLPLADGRCSIVWSQPAAAAARRLALPEAAFLDELGSAAGGLCGAALAVGARRSVPLQLLLARRYVSQRLVLIGDAAHVVHPLAGQGLNLGLRDVLCLVRELAAAQAGGQPFDTALRAYERERRSENTLATRGVDLLGRLFEASGPLALLRGFGVNLVDRASPAKALLAQLAAGRLGRPFGP